MVKNLGVFWIHVNWVSTCCSVEILITCYIYLVWGPGVHIGAGVHVWL